MSPELRVWTDLSDQIPSISKDLKRLERWDRTDAPDPFSFESIRYKGKEPIVPLVWYPARDFMEQSKRLFDWDDRYMEFEDRDRVLPREPLLVNIGIRNNTDRELTIIWAVLRLNKVRFDWTSAGDASALIPEQHRPPASQIRFRWPISPNEIDELLLQERDSVIAHREDKATFSRSRLS